MESAKKKYLILLVVWMGIYLMPSGVRAQVWTNTAGGDWGNSANWSGGVPNASDALADFSTLDLNADVTVTVDGQYTVGGLIFGNIDASPAMSWTVNSSSSANYLNLSDDSGLATITVENLGAGQNATISANLTGPSDLMVDGPGTLVLAGTNTYADIGTTTVTNGATLTIGAPNTLPTSTALFLGDYDNGTIGNLDLPYSQAVAELITQGLDATTNLTWWPVNTNENVGIPTNVIAIPNGQTLTVNGSAFFGYDPSGTNVAANFVTMTGGGSFVDNVNGGLFRVGASDQATTTSPLTTILDMSGLSSANINLGTNMGDIVYVGDLSKVAAVTGSNVISELILASNTTITANSLIVAPSERLNPDILELGSGSNIFNVTSNLMSVERDWAQVYFRTNTGSLRLRASDGVSPALFGNINTIAGANGARNPFVDFGNHCVDMLTSLLRIGYDRRGGYNSNYFGFANGVLNTTELDVGIRSGNPSAAGFWHCVCNLGGGTVIIGTNGIAMGTSAGTYSSTTATNWAELNISGGLVTVNGNIVLMSQTATTGLEQAISTLNITGGTNTVYGDIYCKNATNPGPHTSTLTLNGGVLDLTGNAIGGINNTSSNVVNLIDVLNFQAGTLQNIGQINGGGTPLVMNGSGTLILSGVNTYTGGTIVSNGTLEVNQDGALGMNNVTVEAGAGLELTGGVTNGYINGGASLLLAAGANPVNLNFTGAPNHIARLSFDGGATFQVAGTWGSLTSSATYKTNILQGSGLLLVQSLVQSPTTITLTSSESTSVYGQSVTFTASVTGGVGTPTGTVTFYNGAVVLGSGTLNGSGVATYASSTLPSGADTITAVYNGDSNYASATSSPLLQSVIVIPIIQWSYVNETNLTLWVNGTVAGYDYILESTPMLTSPTVWTVVSTNAGTGGSITNLVPLIPGISQQFFRYQVATSSIPSFNLVDQARPQAVIVIGSGATEVEQFAASELQSYVAQITGVSIPILTDEEAATLPATNEIDIGQPETNPRIAELCAQTGLQLDTNLLGCDGYVVKSIDTGTNTALMLAGSNNRSSLFAVYNLLETFGVRFFGYKSRNGEIVPHQSSIVIPALNIVEKPSMIYRFVSDNGVADSNTNELIAIADWGAKNRCNAFMLTPAEPGRSWSQIPLDEIQKRGFLIAGPGHILAQLTPSTNLFAAHPEYFPLINGVRNMEYSSEWGGALSFDYCNAMQIVVSNAVAYYEQYPFINLLAIYPPDGSQHSVQSQSTCCQQFSESSWYLTLLNNIDMALRQLPTHPKLMWIAYDELSVPPTNTVVPYDNGQDFILVWCNQIRNFAEPMDSASNFVAAQYLQWNTSLISICTDWKTNPGNQDLASYYRWQNWSNYLKSCNYEGSSSLLEYYNLNVSESLSVPMLSYCQSGPWPDGLMQTDFEFYLAQDITGWQNCTDYYNDNPSPYWNQLSAQLMWNPSADVAALDQDFYQQLYGPAATVMQDYWTALWHEIGLSEISLASSNRVAALSQYLNEANAIAAQTNNAVLNQWLNLANIFQTHCLDVESNNLQNYNSNGSPK